MFTLACNVELPLSVKDVMDHIEIPRVQMVRCIQFAIKDLTHVCGVVF